MYELVRERTIVQSYQFARLGASSKRNGKTFDLLESSSDAIAGRPTLDDLVRAKGDGFNHVWFYTKVDDEPELVDGIDL